MNVTGWPGGKPPGKKQPGDVARPGDDIFPKRVVVFSPHPDDDVISMGGTLIRLVEQGHEVHVAYKTSGNIAVFDSDALRFADFATEFNRAFGIDIEELARIEDHIENVPPPQEARADRQPGSPADQGAHPLQRGQGGRAAVRRAARRTCTSSTCRSTRPGGSPRSRSARRTST